MATTIQFLLHLLLLLLCCFSTPVVAHYEATWESLDSRPLPGWYEDAKFGIFLHWGVFSVPSFGSEWFWYALNGMHDERYQDFISKTEGNSNRFSYQDYASRFDALFYKPKDWANYFSKSGAQYVVLTSKHHEGYCMWDSRNVSSTYNWNVMNVGPKRDLLGELATAVQNETSSITQKKMKFGIYHSMFEWYNWAYQDDQRNNYTTRNFCESKTIPELYDLVQKYQPDLIWSDGSWDASSDYWGSKQFLAWLANDSPVKDTVVWNDRWGNDALCKHGSYYTCQDRYTPSELVHHKWENCWTMDKSSWGYNRNSTYEDYYSTAELIHTLISTVALGGNLLLNIGPTADGRLDAIFVDRLLGIGEWLRVNGEAIYGTKPWSIAQTEQNGKVWFTEKNNVVHVIFTNWPKESILEVHAIKPPHDDSTIDNVVVKMLGHDEILNWGFLKQDGGMRIDLPYLTPDIIPCQHAWVLEITGLLPKVAYDK